MTYLQQIYYAITLDTVVGVLGLLLLAGAYWVTYLLYLRTKELVERVETLEISVLRGKLAEAMNSVSNKMDSLDLIARLVALEEKLNPKKKVAKKDTKKKVAKKDTKKTTKKVVK